MKSGVESRAAESTPPRSARARSPLRLTSSGRVLDQRPQAFGVLRDSSALATDGAALCARLDEDGYVFLRRLLDVRGLFRIQTLVAKELARRGVLDPAGDASVDVLPARPGTDLYCVMSGLSETDLTALSRQPALLALFNAIFGEEAKPLDYRWPRVASPGRCADLHCDWIYMNRGTSKLLTAWIPLMDMPMKAGPLMLLERSHKDNASTRSYFQMDADRLGFLEAVRIKHGALVRGGRFSVRPDRAREDFGTRWLSADFELGDVVVFTTRCLHGTLDNQSAGFRASIDLRFQPLSEPTDPRFDGPSPVAHAARDPSIFEYLVSLREAFRELRNKARRATAPANSFTRRART